MRLRPAENLSTGALIKRALEDLKVIIRSELELAKVEVSGEAKHAALDVVAILTGAVVLLFGAAMLCGAIVAALALTVLPLWASLLIVGGVFVLAGAAVALGFLQRLRHKQLRPAQAELEARNTVKALQGIKGIKRLEEQPAHA